MSSNETLVCDTHIVHVYIATIPENVRVCSILPKQREQEINACSHERVKKEKYCAWKLLEYALKHSFGVSLSELEELDFQKTEQGKWITPACHFSITHCDGVVAVAVSTDKVGVDVEKCSDKLRSASRRFLTEKETLFLQTLKACEQLAYLAQKWTQKESVFKAFEEGSFAPSRIETDEYKTLTKTLENGYILSVASNELEQIRWYQDINYL